MTFLGALTAIGLYVLDVPFALTFGIFTGLVAIIPFFGTLLSTTLPALFVLTAPDGGIARALRRRRLGVVVHLIEGNIVSPLRDVEEGRSAAGADDHVGAHHRHSCSAASG